jgi:uncharacterized membrane protein
MQNDKRAFRTFAAIGIAAVAVALAGTGVFFAVRSRRKTRFQRVAAQARRVLRRDVAHLGRKVRSRVDHMSS